MQGQQKGQNGFALFFQFAEISSTMIVKSNHDGDSKKCSKRK